MPREVQAACHAKSLIFLTSWEWDRHKLDEPVESPTAVSTRGVNLRVDLDHGALSRDLGVGALTCELSVSVLGVRTGGENRVPGPIEQAGSFLGD